MQSINLDQNLSALVEIARLAPSVHNTQPWRVKAEADSIIVSIDRRYALKDGDQTGRQTIISLGIFCEALAIAAPSLGLTVTAVKLYGQQAQLSVKSGPKADARQQATIDLLKVRHSDRSIYKPVQLETASIKTIEKSAPDSTTTIMVVTDPVVLAKIAELTSKGIGLAMSSPGFRKELSEYLVVPGSGKHRGIAVTSLYINPLLAAVQPWMIRAGIGLKAEASLEKRRWESASAVVLLLNDGDLSHYWLEAGRAYLRASLAITAADLSQATSAAIVEASNYHDDIEELLGTKQRILGLIRVGKGSDNHHFSPRVSVSELLDSSIT